MTFAEKILDFNKNLSEKKFNLPDGFKIINPFNGDQKIEIEKATKIFYTKYYNDSKKHRIILGSSPARRGSAITGIPFEDATHIYEETGISIKNFVINNSSSNFLYEVINKYGGFKKFYSNFYMNFVCPLGISKLNGGKETNCNYYENKDLVNCLYDFIIESIKKQVDFGINTDICYCIGSGENYDFLTKINNKYHFFTTIIPLEHPRFIMQYNSKNKNAFIDKYIKCLLM